MSLETIKTEKTQTPRPTHRSPKDAVLCSPPQSPYGLHWTPLNFIWTLPKKWPSLDWSPVHFSLKLSLKSNDIYHSAAFFALSLKIVILYWLWWCYISFYSIFRAEFEKYNTLLIRILDMDIVELYRIRHWIYWVWIL